MPVMTDPVFKRSKVFKTHVNDLKKCAVKKYIIQNVIKQNILIFYRYSG